MSDRERLMELITKEVPRPKADALAYHLLANGVIVPPCNCVECKHFKIVDKAPIFAECSNPKVIRKFLYFEEDTRKASCEYAEAKLKECEGK
jgi:hypothetical protein